MVAPVIVVIGAPGAGKSVQCDLLAERLHGRHLSSGQILRASADSGIQKQIESGELVDLPDYERVVGESLSTVASDQLLVLDGFVRTRDDLDWLETTLARQGRQIRQVVFINLSEAAARERTLVRGRADDTAAALAERWKEYRRDTEPVLEVLRERPNFVEIDGSGSIEEVAQSIAERVQ